MNKRFAQFCHWLLISQVGQFLHSHRIKGHHFYYRKVAAPVTRWYLKEWYDPNAKFKGKGG